MSRRKVRPVYRDIQEDRMTYSRRFKIAKELLDRQREINDALRVEIKRLQSIVQWYSNEGNIDFMDISKSEVNKAIKYFGGRRMLARILGLSVNEVDNWAMGNQVMLWPTAVRIQTLSNNHVNPHRLCMGRNGKELLKEHNYEID